VENIYTSGRYQENKPMWHAEDAPWKAEQIRKIIDKNKIQPKNIAEIGCGSGAIINELSKMPYLQGACFEGNDISPQAIEIAKQFENERIQFYQEDFLSEDNDKYFDILMAIDVFEHVPDYMGFLNKCRRNATYKIYHIPLEIHVSSIFRNTLICNRYSVGHIHYFTADSALASLRDSGHEIVDSFYTNAAIELFTEHPSINRAVANVPRWLFSKFSVPFTARLLGGYSLLVLAK